MKYKINVFFKIKNFFLVFIFFNGDSFSDPVGLRQLGNSCYINSALQVLANIDDFREYFINENFGESKILCNALKEFLKEYTTNSSSLEVKLQNLLTKINEESKKHGREEYANGGENDSLEFLNWFLENLYREEKVRNNNEESDKESDEESDEESKIEINNVVKGSSKIDELFLIKFIWSHTCSNCNFENKTNEFSYIFNLSLPDIKKFDCYCNFSCCCECYKQYHKGNEITFFDLLKTQCKPSKRCKRCFQMCPYILGNFKFNSLNKYFFLKWDKYKEKASVTVKLPEYIDLNEFCVNNMGTKYRLFAVIKYFRSIKHYIAIVRVNDNWYKCNDSTIEKISQERVYNKNKELNIEIYKDNYGFVYEKCDV